MFGRRMYGYSCGEGGRGGVSLVEHWVEERRNPHHLLVETFGADGFELLLAVPRGPFGLGDPAVAHKMRCGRFDCDTAVVGHGSCGTKELLGIEVVACQLDDIGLFAVGGVAGV